MVAPLQSAAPVEGTDKEAVEVASPSKKLRNLKRWVPILLLAFSALGFSIQALMVRSLTVQGIGTFQLLIFRGSCQAFGCCVCLSAKGTALSSWLGSTRLERTALLVRAIVGYGGICFGFLCVSALPLADSQILGQTAPIFSAAFARIFLKEEWHCSEFFSAMAAILGVGFISKPETLLDASRVPQLGVLYGLLSAFFAGATYVIIRFLGTAKVDWASVLLAQALGQVALSPIALVVSGQHLRLLSRQQLAVALGIGFFGFASQVAMTKGMQKEKSATASLIRQSLCPVFAMLWQPLCFPEDQLSWTSFAGCASLLLLLVSTFSFSIQVLLVRWLTQQGIGTFQLLLVRGSCQGLGCCLWLRGQPLETWLGTTLLEYQALFVRAVLGYCALCFCFMSISLMPFADALILGQTAPIFWQILGWGLLEEAWHVSDTVSASTALFGVGFLCKPPGPLSSFTIFRGFRHFVGFLCGLLGCVSTGSAAETLVIHWVGRVKVSWPSVVLAQALGQLIISPFAVAVSGEPLRLFTQQQLGVALLLSLLGFASQIAQIQGMQQARIASASLIHYMFCPLLGLLYQHLVFEELTWTSFAGYGFVSTAIVMSHLAKERRAQLAQPAKYSEVARSEAHSEGEGSPAQSVECMGFNPQDASVYGKRSFFDEGPGQDREDEMIEGLRSDGFSRRQAELALAEVQWSSREEALDVLLDVKFQLSSNGKALEPGADSARPAGPLRPVQEANEASEANEAEG